MAPCEWLSALGRVSLAPSRPPDRLSAEAELLSCSNWHEGLGSWFPVSVTQLCVAVRGNLHDRTRALFRALRSLLHRGTRRSSLLARSRS